MREWKQREVEKDGADADGGRVRGVLRNRSGTFVVPQRLLPVIPRERYAAAEEDVRRAMDTAARLPFLRRHHVPRVAPARDDCEVLRYPADKVKDAHRPRVSLSYIIFALAGRHRASGGARRALLPSSGELGVRRATVALSATRLLRTWGGSARWRVPVWLAPIKGRRW